MDLSGFPTPMYILGEKSKELQTKLKQNAYLQKRTDDFFF